MARRLDWQKRAFDSKPKRAFQDEEEFHKTDRAARFIARAEQSPEVPRYDHRKVPSGAKRQADADRQRTRASANRAVREKPSFKSDPTAQWLNRPQSAKPTRQQHHKPKSGNGKTTVIPGDGDPCARCGVPMEIREHNGIAHKQLRQPFYYTRWFCCMNKSCRTTLVMPERYKVINSIVRSNPGFDNTIAQPEPADPNERPPWE